MQCINHVGSVLFAALGFMNVSVALAGQQQVLPSQTEFYPNAGETVTFNLDYQADSLQLSGLGVSLYFDDKALEFLGFQSCFPTGNVGQDVTATADKDDADENPQTTQLATVAWTSLNSQWPGENTVLPLTLCSAQFKVKDGFSGETQIDIRGEAAAGEEFVGGPVVVFAP